MTSQSSSDPADRGRGVPEAIYDALARADLARAVELADGRWGELVRLDAGALRAVAGALPRALPEEWSPELRAAAGRVHELAPFVLSRPHATVVATTPTAAAKRVEQLTALSSAHRREGRFAEAAEAAEEAETLVNRHPRAARHGAPRFAADRLRRGRSLALAMHEVRAREVLTLAYDAAIADGEVLVAAASAADLGLLDAVNGRGVAADLWLTRSEMIARAHHLEGANPVLAIARARRALDRDDSARALELTLPLMRDSEGELAVLVACTRALACADSRASDARYALAELEALLAAIPASRRASGVNRMWIASARVELHLRLRDLARVRAELDDFADAVVQMAGPAEAATAAGGFALSGIRARLHYTIGDYASALAEATVVMRVPEVHRWPRAVAGASALLAAISMRRGDHPGARRSYVHALTLAREHDVWSAISVIPLADRDALRALVLGTNPGSPPVPAQVPGSAPETREQLTEGEAAVAVAFARGQALQAIAASRAVSVNTVKTQLRNAYRKLGVTGRAALAAEVERIGLAPRAPRAVVGA